MFMQMFICINETSNFAEIKRMGGKILIFEIGVSCDLCVEAASFFNFWKAFIRWNMSGYHVFRNFAKSLNSEPALGIHETNAICRIREVLVICGIHIIQKIRNMKSYFDIWEENGFWTFLCSLNEVNQRKRKTNFFSRN